LVASQTMLTTRTIREALAGLGLLCLCTSLPAHWNDLPSRVPVHFGLNGHPDGFGSKTILWVLPATAVVLYLTLTVVSRYPAYFNFPVPVTDLNRQTLRDLAIDMLGWIRAEMMCIFAWLMLATISTAEGRSSGLGAAFAPVSIGVIAATIALFWYRMIRTRTTP
jgi:uncharacterized membrane protein